MLRLIPTLLTLAAAPLTLAQSAAIEVCQVASDGAVLQRNAPLRLWGFADPDEDLTLRFGGASVETTVDERGRWRATLPAQRASAQPRPLTIAGEGGRELVVKDLLVGDVWLCAGQSNMSWQLRQTEQGKAAITASSDPLLRLLTVPSAHRASPLESFAKPARWRHSGPETTPAFSAVAYHFGRALRAELKVPIGLIVSAWPGTRIEPWIPALGYAATPGLLDKIAAADRKAPHRPHPLQQPSQLWNGMVAPLAGFSLRGAIWYQGESNVADRHYLIKLRTLMASYRKAWKQPELPFLVTQIAPFGYEAQLAPHVPELWHAQRLATRGKHSGLAITADLGDPADIHPRRKRPVGERLARLALVRCFGKPGPASGPIVRDVRRAGDQLVISFDDARGLCALDGKPLRGFELQLADDSWRPAEAQLSGETVTLTAPAGAKAVRLGWQQLANPNLGNAAKIPALPFRQGISE